MVGMRGERYAHDFLCFLGLVPVCFFFLLISFIALLLLSFQEVAMRLLRGVRLSPSSPLGLGRWPLPLSRRGLVWPDLAAIMMAVERMLACGLQLLSNVPRLRRLLYRLASFTAWPCID